jgi:hypothetical protein
LALTYPPSGTLRKRLREIAREEFGAEVARLLWPYWVDIIEQCEGQPRAAIELMGVVGTALAGDPKALSDQMIAKKIIESFFDGF